MEESHSKRVSSTSLSEPTTPGQIRGREIPPMQRADPTRFVKARAHLAATLTGANVEQLQKEVGSAMDRVNTWQSTKDQPLSKMQGQQIFEKTLQRDYVTAYRFQNESGHNKPKQKSTLSAMAEVRALHGGQYNGPETLSDLKRGLLLENRTDHEGAAIIGAHHTKGFNVSPFVSLVAEPELLTQSKDDGKNGAKSIATGAKSLHTYVVPKVTAWTPQRMLGVLERSSDGNGGKWIDEQIEGGNGEQTYKEWLTSTPSQETEVLFHGNDLDKYRTNEVKNPYLPKRKK